MKKSATKASVTTIKAAKATKPASTSKVKKSVVKPKDVAVKKPHQPSPLPPPSNAVNAPLAASAPPNPVQTTPVDTASVVEIIDLTSDSTGGAQADKS